MTEEMKGSEAGGAPASAGKHGELKGSEPSYWPIILSAGMTLVAIGLLGRLAALAAGVVVMGVALVGWAWQPWGE